MRLAILSCLLAALVSATGQVQLPPIPKELLAQIPKPLVEAPQSSMVSMQEHQESLAGLAQLARVEPAVAKAVGASAMAAPAAPSAPAPSPKTGKLGEYNVHIPHAEPPLVKLPPATFPSKPMTPEDAALQAIKEDVTSKSAEIQKEQTWVKDVEEIVSVYGKKLEAVKDHVNDLRIEVKALYKKKKQLENLKAQKGLEDKLGDAHDDLQMLQAALSHVKARAEEFSKIRGEVQKTIEANKAKLAELNGPKKPVPTL